MGQMAIGTYTSDFLFGFWSRVGGTIVGGTIGLVCWYIGDGNNGGNPYGMAVIVGVAIVGLMWLRLFLPIQWMQATLLMSATTFLVIGYSWVDTYAGSPLCCPALLTTDEDTFQAMETLALDTMSFGSASSSS
jgi:hypothetical protein